MVQWLTLHLLKLIIGLLLSYSVTHAQVVISEVMWAGSHVSTADEWLELTNFGQSQSLSGWTLTYLNSSAEERVINKFSSGTQVSSGQYLLIANYQASDSALAADADVITTAVTLPNTKLLLRLYNASGALVDQVDDGIGKPFAGLNKAESGADLVWASMERINLSGSGTLKENWQTAVASVGFDSGALVFGTPGSKNIIYNPESGTGASGVGRGVVISEVLANPIGSDDYEWIELQNISTGSVTLNDWQLTDGSRSYTFSGVTLGSGEFLVMDRLETDLSLSNQGETIQLLDENSLIVDQVEYQEALEGVAWGRSGSGFTMFCIPTRGAPNQQISPVPQISIQSGEPTAPRKVTINLQGQVMTGSLVDALCSWDYGDSYLSDSCNPPSHTFSEVGEYQVSLTVTDACSFTGSTLLPVTVQAVASRHDNPDPKPEVCEVLSTTGVRISEVIPNPYGEEKLGEWVELQNISSEPVSLCGWQLDDENGGSKPFLLDGFSLAAGEYLVLERAETGIAFNNYADEVRLLLGSGNVVEQVAYAKVPEGEALALRDDGLMVQTPYLTPGEADRFRSAERQYETDKLIVSAALPNPVGKDSDGEWIEISNVSEQTVDLTGWQLDNKPGGSPPFALTGQLESGQLKRFTIGETGLTLVNTSDTARLLDPDAYTASLISWVEAVEGRIYRPPVSPHLEVEAQVTRVIDGDTIEVVLTNVDDDTGIPDSLRRRWFGGAGEGIVTRLIGVDTPETVHPNLPVQAWGQAASQFTRQQLEGKAVVLSFEAELWDKYNRLLAYVEADKRLIQAKLLQQGLAAVYRRFPFTRQAEFEVYEQEARQAKLGLWSDDEAVAYVSDEVDEALVERTLEEVGLTLSFNPAPGLVATGTMVQAKTSVPADVYLAFDGGDFSLLSGGILVEQDQVLLAYAEFVSGTGSIRSELLEAYYAVPKSDYKSEVVFSEIYPSPLKGEQEWIELFNPTSHSVNLTGWQLADRKKSARLSGKVHLNPRSYKLIYPQELGLNSNNSGDDFKLISPDDEVEITVSYPKIKKGQGWCLTERQRSEAQISDVATPGRENFCYKFRKDSPDSDQDGLRDDLEQWKYFSNPTDPDTDGDTFPDGFEVKQGVSPIEFNQPTRELRLAYRDELFKKNKPKQSRKKSAKKLPVVAGVMSWLRQKNEHVYAATLEDKGSSLALIEAEKFNLFTSGEVPEVKLEASVIPLIIIILALLAAVGYLLRRLIFK